MSLKKMLKKEMRESRKARKAWRFEKAITHLENALAIIAAQHSAHSDAVKPANLQADSNADNLSTSQAVA